LAQSWRSDGGGLDEVIDEMVVPVKAWRAEDRLTSVELLTLLVSYREGATARALAERYELGLTTMKRLLRKYGVGRSSTQGGRGA
jgi:hypothetical protein